MDQVILKRFIKGKATAEEVRKVLKWYYSDEAEYVMAEKIDKLWNQVDQETINSKLDKSQLLEKIKEKVQIHENNIQYQIKPAHSIKPNVGLIFKVAASIILVLSISWLLVYFSNSSLSPKENLQVKEVNMLQKATAKGQKFTIFLADGTKVKLNAESQLEYPQSFSDTNRVVYLTGEAFFDIKKDTKRPFTVISHDLSTTALGTSFNINAYPENDNIIVSLATGSVKVSHDMGNNIDKSNIFLEPGNQAIYSSSRNSIKKQFFDENIDLAWKEGVLYFEDASWDQIVNKLERWYGVDISVINLKNRSNKLYTGFFKDESLDNVLESLSFSKNFKYKIKSQKVYVEFK